MVAEIGMIEVFKTNVLHKDQAELILALLLKSFPAFRINFDLDDCDKILRVEGNEINPNQIIDILVSGGYHCEVLV